jgi:DNA-binding GntR family transcriptional regulator
MTIAVGDGSANLNDPARDHPGEARGTAPRNAFPESAKNEGPQGADRLWQSAERSRPVLSGAVAAPPPQPHEMDLVGLPLSHHVAAFVREAILQGSFRPGEQLVESNIARQLNLSRGPVRDGLKLLEREGLVSIIPRRGAFVARLEKADVWEIASLRAVLEGLAARILAERKDEMAAERLEAVLRDMAAVGDENPVQFATLDLRFHEILIQVTDHKRLLQFWINLRTQIWLFIRETRLGGLRPAGSTVEIHRAILDAIRAGDALEAERVARSHSEFSGRQLEVHLSH